MSFFKEKPLLRLPPARFLIISYCLVSIFLDFYFKYNPDLPWCHLLTGTSPTFEIAVIVGILIGTATSNRIAHFVCLLDVILGFICILTLPVISTAENATGSRLNLPFVSTFHSTWEVSVRDSDELLFVTIIIGFFSTLLIFLFLCLDLLKLMLIIRLCRQDQKKQTNKINIEAQNTIEVLKF